MALGVKISVLVRVFKLAYPLPKFGGVCQGITGGVASPIDFLFKIEISNMSLINEILQAVGTLHF